METKITLAAFYKDVPYYVEVTCNPETTEELEKKVYSCLGEMMQQVKFVMNELPPETTKVYGKK